MKLPGKKRTYEEMEQHFATHQLVASEPDDLTLSSQSSNGSENSCHYSANISNSKKTTLSNSRYIAVFYSLSLKFLTGEKSLIEMGIKY